MKRFKRIFLFTALAFVGIALLFGFGRLWIVDDYCLPVMMYHKVENSERIRADTVSPETFEYHMQYLKTHGFKVIGLSEFVMMREKGIDNKDLPRKTVVITFDDGYENNYTVAYPILKKYGHKATIFISPDFFGEFREGKQFLGEKQIRTMQEEGLVSFGSHGMTQAYLPEISYQEQQFELGRSKRILVEKFGMPANCFSYPVGGFDSRIKEEVKKAGYRCAVTTNRGNDRFNRDIYEINRIRFSDKDDKDSTLWAKLNGFYNLFRKMKDPY